MQDKSLPAERLARRLHGSQRDHNDEPCVDHLARVVAILLQLFPDATSPEIEAAWLHNALATTPMTTAELRAADVSAEAVTIVELLTKPALLPYLSWVRRIAFSGHHSAVRVKLADNEDNAAQARIRTWADRERLAQRYQPTRAILLQALRGDRSR